MVTHNGRVTTPDPKPEPETQEATEYERQLSDPELAALAIDVQSRISALLAQGVPLPMQEIENHHLIGLLECFVGREESLRVREWHLSWVDRMLDQTEAAIRMRMIGLLDTSAAGPS